MTLWFPSLKPTSECWGEVKLSYRLTSVKLYPHCTQIYMQQTANSKVVQKGCIDERSLNSFPLFSVQWSVRRAFHGCNAERWRSTHAVVPR